MAALVADDLREPGDPELAERVAPYRAGYTPAAAPRARAPAGRRRAARASSRRTRWSSASTSARSTRPSSSRSPARSPRCARCGAGPGAAAAAWPSTSPARTRSTSSSAATRTSSSTGPWRRRSSTTRTSRSTAAHLLCAAHEGPLERGRRRVPRARAGAATPSGCVARAASSRRARAARFVLRHPEGYPAAERVAALGLGATRSRSSTCRVGRGARHGRGRARASRPSTRAPIYLHLGRSYEVAGLDLEAPPRRSSAPFAGDWYTQPKRETDTDDRAPARPPRGARRDAVVRRAWR